MPFHFYRQLFFVVISALTFFAMASRSGAQLPTPVSAAADGFDAQNILIRFKETVDEAQRITFEQRESLAFVSEIKTIRVRLYRLPAGTDVSATAIRFTQDTLVDFAEPDFHRKLNAVDPEYANQWSLNNTGQTVNGSQGPANIDINWPEAMARFHGTTPITVAVIDSGVALLHSEIFPNIYVKPTELYGVAGVDDDGNGLIDDFSGYDFFKGDYVAVDENGHGTLVASIIAGAINNGIGGAGICPTAKIMSLRVLSQFGQGGAPKFARVSDVALALDYAGRNGARIVNLSIGGSSYSSTEQAIISALSSAGILIIAAAGNGGSDGIGDNNDSLPVYPASYNFPNLLAVAAQDRSGALAGFSNFGLTTVHLAAPGTDIFGADITRRIIFAENFDSGAPGWTSGASLGNLSPRPWSIDTYLGNNFLADHLFDATYYPYVNTWVRSPLIDLRSQSGSRLSFYTLLSLADDYLAVELSLDGFNWFAYRYLFGVNNGFSYQEIDISDLDGFAGYFRFRLVSNGSYQGGGVWIDGISVTAINPLDTNNPTFQYRSGTSFAAPIVSGVAALVMSQRPDLSASQVKAILLNSAKQVPALSGKISSGRMVDALAALQLADTAVASPSILTQPTSQSVMAGSNVSFSVTASGAPAPGYQWQRQAAGTSGFVNLANGGSYAGVTTGTLTVSAATVAMRGDLFQCIVSNGVGSPGTSASVSLTVNAAPVFTSAPGTTFNNSVFGSFTVSASGAPAPTFSVTGGVLPSWSTLNATTGALGGTPPNSVGAPYSFTLTASNGFAPAATQVFTLTVVPLPVAPAIATAPAGQSVTVGGTIALTVLATGTPAPSYQWRLNGTLIPGETNATFTRLNAQLSDAGSYTVFLANIAGSITSPPAIVSVISAGMNAQHAVTRSGYIPGGTVTVTAKISYSGGATGLSWQVLLPAGWTFASSFGDGGATKPIVGVGSLAEWTWSTPPASPVAFSYTLNVPAGATGAIPLVGTATVLQNAVTIPLLAKPDPLSLVAASTRHNADYDGDGKIGLVELTRVIELYNTRIGTTRTGCYAVAITMSEDGFAADGERAGAAVVTLSHYHSADTGRDGRFSLIELTRVIELYNTRAGTARTGAYHVQAGTEDGFAPGP